jgi:hypothetical protein
LPALLDFVQHRFRSHVFFEIFDLGVDLGLDTQPLVFPRSGEHDGDGRGFPSVRKAVRGKLKDRCAGAAASS